MTLESRRADGARSSFSKGRASFGFFRQIAAHKWAKPLVRVVSVAVALLVLVAIGSSARAIPSAAAPLPGASQSASTPISSAPVPAASSAPSTQTTPAQSSPPLEHAKRATVDDPVLLNSASLDDLERLPGIGPKRAQAILDLRRNLGRFRQVEDLMRVKGIGRATLKKLRPIVRLD